MKTLNTTFEAFASDAMTQVEMNYLMGGGDPQDMLIPPHGRG